MIATAIEIKVDPYASMLKAIKEKVELLTSGRFPFLRNWPEEELTRVEGRLLRFDGVKPETLPRGRIYTALYQGLQWGEADSLDSDIALTWTPSIKVRIQGDTRTFKTETWAQACAFAHRLDRLGHNPSWGMVAQAADKAIKYPHEQSTVIGAYAEASEVEQINIALDRTLKSMADSAKRLSMGRRHGRRALGLDSTGLEACELSRLATPSRDGASKAIDLARRAHRASRYGCQDRASRLAQRADDAMSMIK